MAQPIIVQFDDRSASGSTSTSTVAGTVIKNDRGSDQPVLFYPGQEKRILNYLGVPDTGKEAVQDVLDYNTKYAIWVSSPSIGGKYGGALVTKTGTIPFVGGKTTKEITFSAIVNTESVATGNGVLTNFDKTIVDFAHYTKQTVDLLVNGVSIVVVASDAEPEVLTTTPNIGAGTFTRATGVLDFTFTTAPATTDVITIKYTVNRSADAYFAVFNTNAQVDDLKLKTAKTTANQFTLTLQQNDQLTSTYKTVSGFPQTVSTIPNTKNGNGVNIYAPTYFANDDRISVIVNTSLTVNTFTDDTSYISFAGGLRGASSTSALTAGWAYFQDKSKYKSNLFFDTSAESTVPALLATMRTSYQTYADYLIPLANDTSTAIIADKAGFSLDNRGLKFFATGWGVTTNLYKGTEFTGSLMGKVALRYADIANDAYRGLAPAWYNANGKWGGQLGGGVVSLVRNWNDTEVEALKAVRINPVVFDTSFGLVITSQLTSQSLESDYAYQAHSGLADFIVQNVVEKILPYQLSKPNDSFHRTSISNQISTVLRQVQTVGTNQLLNNFLVQCDELNNDADALSRREFIVDVYVQFTPTSETIRLNFINDAQGNITVA